MTHVMLDLETWGLQPGCDLRSIGAVVFDPFHGSLGGDFYVNTNSGAQWGLVRDAGTVAWWEQQSAAAKAAFNRDIWPLDTALELFSNWMREVQCSRLWAMGPNFDVSILEAVYLAVGKKVPWHYRAPRCVRTMIDLAGIGKPPIIGTEHNALDDAKSQALHVIEAYKVLGLH